MTMECKRIYFIRHGERADYAAEALAPKYDVSYDPCLTYQGQTMAYKVGNYLKRTLLPNSKIRVISSPMLRCLETSSIILKTLNLQANIEVDTHVCEELLTIQYASNPTPGLLLRTKNYDKMKLEDTRGYDFIDDKIILNYPESMDETSERFVERFKKYEKECNNIIIVVSHGRGVNEFMEYYDPGNKMWNSKYCSISMVEQQLDGEWRLQLKDYTDHLKEKYFMMLSESEGEGCPDKICDLISDTIVDASIALEPSCYVNINTIIKNNRIFIIGENKCTKPIDYNEIVKNVLKGIGYDSAIKGIDYREVKIELMITPTVHDNTAPSESTPNEILSNTGVVTGYATNEWNKKSLMPFSHYIASQITKQIDICRKEGKIKGLFPYCKTQAKIEYRLSGTDLKPLLIKYIAICVHYDTTYKFDEIKKEIMKLAIEPVIPEEFKQNKYEIYISHLESPIHHMIGMTGRKILSDSYGGWGKHICGAYSGKCPSKIERAGSYFCRYIAKNLVAHELCSRVLVQMTYSCCIKLPLAVNVYTFGTVINEITDRKLKKMVSRNYNLDVSNILKVLNLERPIYSKTSIYGQFGGDDADFTWEKITKNTLSRGESL